MSDEAHIFQKGIPSNSADFFEKPLIKPTGFREYDVRWRIEGTDEPELNYSGLVILGRAFGTFLFDHLAGFPDDPKVVVSHDFRSYSQNVKNAFVLGLLRQQVRTFFCVLGHGSTEVGEVLRVYAQAGLVRVCGVRSEIEASHAATALRWVTGEKAAVVTSIGPGALQALAASIVPASDGIGARVWPGPSIAYSANTPA